MRLKFAFGQDAQCLAQVGQQGVADLGGNLQGCFGLLVFPPEREDFGDHGGQVPGVEAEAVIAWSRFQQAAIDRRGVLFQIDDEQAVVTGVGATAGMAGPGFEQFVHLGQLVLPELVGA